MNKPVLYKIKPEYAHLVDYTNQQTSQSGTHLPDYTQSLFPVNDLDMEETTAWARELRDVAQMVAI